MRKDRRKTIVYGNVKVKCRINSPQFTLILHNVTYGNKIQEIALSEAKQCFLTFCCSDIFV